MEHLTHAEPQDAADATAGTPAPEEAAMPGTPTPVTEPALPGRPETPEGYGFSPGESASGYDTALADWFRGTAHELGVSAEMAVALHDRFRDRVAEVSGQAWSDAEARRADAEAALRQDWGRGYEARLTDALHAVDRFGGDALKAALNDSGLGDDPVVVRAFAEIGRTLANGGAARSAAGTTDTSSPTMAQREILRLRSDEKFMAAYGDRSHPSHDIAQAQMDELYARAYPADRKPLQGDSR